VFPDLKLQWLSWGCTPQTPSLGNIWAQATPVTNLQHRILQILRMVQIIQNLRIFFFHWSVKILYICLSCNCVILSTAFLNQITIHNWFFHYHWTCRIFFKKKNETPTLINWWFFYRSNFLGCLNASYAIVCVPLIRDILLIKSIISYIYWWFVHFPFDLYTR
jgi:hypothetical protein